MPTPFPTSLAPHRALIESTTQPTVLFTLTRGATQPWQSKIGGTPYFPLDHPVDTYHVPYPNTVNLTPWPKHPQTGKELTLLAQINFEEMPALPSFPDRGLLQIFVDEAHWHELDRGMRAVYHPEVLRDPARLFSDFKHDPEENPERLLQLAMAFETEDEVMTVSDFRFDPLLYQAVSTNQTAWRDYLHLTDFRHKDHPDVAYGRNKIGGYHYSPNGRDRRASRPDWHDSVLLLQLQDDDHRLTWGDFGTAHLFIKRQDLEQRNFDDLFFSWDAT